MLIAPTLQEIPLPVNQKPYPSLDPKPLEIPSPKPARLVSVVLSTIVALRMVAKAEITAGTSNYRSGIIAYG